MTSKALDASVYKSEVIMMILGDDLQFEGDCAVSLQRRRFILETDNKAV